METVEKMIRTANLMREIAADIPIQAVQSFFVVATKEGLSISDLAKQVGLGQSSASRNVAALSEYKKPGVRGLGLIESRQDPKEARKKRLVLTQKGKLLIDAINEIK